MYLSVAPHVCAPHACLQRAECGLGSFGTEPRSTRAANVLKGWVISLAPKDQFYLEFPLIVLGYVLWGLDFFHSETNKTSSKNEGNSHSNNMQMWLSKESHWGWGGGSEVKSTCCSPRFCPGPNTNALELRDLTISGKERKWERWKRGRKGKEKVKEKENGEVKWKTRLSFSGELSPTETN